MEKQKRDFKGIWIPKEIWLTKELTLQEKVFFIEIDSLNNENGCFASNTYFASFFDLSKSRCTQIITSLKEKGYISVELIRKDRAITKRIIRVIKSIGNTKLGGKFPKLAGENVKLGYFGNSEYNNTDINTTINNTTELDLQITNQTKEKSTPDYELLFNSFYSAFPKHKEKKMARKRLTDILKRSSDYEAKFSEIMEGVKKYKKNLLDNKTELQYTKNPASWLLNERWEDEYEEEKESFVGYNIL